MSDVRRPLLPAAKRAADSTDGSALSPGRKFVLLTSDVGGALFVRARDVVAVGTKFDEDDDGAVVQHVGQGEDGFWVREPVERVLALLESAED